MLGRMNLRRHLSSGHTGVLLAVSTLFAVWLMIHIGELTLTQNGFLRFGLTLFFSSLILLRPKPKREGAKPIPAVGIIAAACAGAFLALCGVVFDIGQFEWLGMLVLLVAGLLWALPRAYAGDIALAAALLYWAHPLPSAIFGPLQLAMQTMSVRGTEWLLYGLDVHAWADGMVLRTGFTTFEVPEWCSGMRAGTTVFLLAWGMGILHRLRWFECIGLVVAALFQALLLNIVRIASMVVLSPRFDEFSSIRFLHDTTGMIVISAIFLVYGEVLFFSYLKRRRARTEHEMQPHEVRLRTDQPPFVGWLRENWGKIALAILVLALTPWLIYANRSGRRVRVLKEIAMAAQDAGRLEVAERVARVAAEKDPSDDDWKLTLGRILLLRQKYEDVLSLEPTIIPNGEAQRIEKSVLRAYSLMALGRMDEAVAIVQTLPARVQRTNPRVAMILAELGFRTDDPSAAASNAVTAAGWLPNSTRIRNLYPYLREHREWNALTDSDSRLPHSRPEPMFSLIEAYMNLNRPSLVASLTLQALSAWPRDPRLLEPLFFMTIKRRDTTWEDRFSSHLLFCANTSDSVDYLYGLLGRCFEITRPDLAWCVYRRIETLDAEHPALLLTAARHGDTWFAMRKRHMGLTAASQDEVVSLVPLYLIGGALPYWQHWCNFIPLAKELSATPTTDFRKDALNRAIAKFRHREAMPLTATNASPLSLPMRYAFAEALEMAGHAEEAHARLAAIGAEYPDEANAVMMRQSEVYERQGKWQQVYETLREHMFSKNPLPEPLLRLCRAQGELGLDLAALRTAAEGVRRFPNSTRPARLLAETLLRIGDPEGALFALEKKRSREDRELDYLEVKALFLTERFREAQAFAPIRLVPDPPIRPDTPQLVSLPSAEISTLWHQIYTPTRQAIAAHAETLRENITNTTSPFLIGLTERWLAAETNAPGEDALSLDRWSSCGRDRIEKAIALNQLTLLSLASQEMEIARRAAAAAVKSFPESARLWHIHISLSDAAADVLESARLACPQDGEIWLAALITGTRDFVAQATNRVQSADEEPAAAPDRLDTVSSDAREWVATFVAEAVQNRTFPAAIMTRAAEYLNRIGLRGAATIAARDAVARARSLLPAYVQSLRSALYLRDKALALRSTQEAIRASLRPIPLFYSKLVELKMSEEPVDIDADMVEALKVLRQTDPDNPLWAQMLGYVRFQRGGWEVVDALNQMIASIEAGATNAIPFVIAAESSRLVGNTERAVDLLRQGLKRQPGNPIMMNNLAYTLGSADATLPEAVQLIEEVLRLNPGNPRYLDTAAVLYLRAGDISRAAECVSAVAAAVDDTSHLWFRTQMLQARILHQRGQTEKAVTMLQGALKHAARASDDDILEGNRLLNTWQPQSLDLEEPPARPPRQAPIIRPEFSVDGNRLPDSSSGDALPGMLLSD